MKKTLQYILLFSLISQLSFAQSAIEFVENKGQWSEDFAFKAQAPGGDIYLQKDGYVVNISSSQNHDYMHAYKHGEIKKLPAFKYHAYKATFLNANSNPQFEASKKQDHYYNYFLGTDQKKWRSEIYPHHAVDYKNIYDGIDAHMFSDQGQLKYDFIISPKANPKKIKIEYDGLDDIRIDDKGNLILATSLGDMQEVKPYAYQFIDGEKKEVPCKFSISGKEKSTVSYKLPKGYDKDYELIIDPVLVFCSFSGSTGDNWGTTATYDQFGNYYGGGFSLATGFPVTTGAYDTTFNGGGLSGGGQPQDVSILKFNDAGNALIYATYIGGTDNEQPHSLIVDTATGNLIIAGRTYSTDFPTTPGCYDNTQNGNADIFVTVLNSSGTALIGSTYIGGTADDGVNVSPNYTTLTSLKHNYGDDARSEVIIDNNANIYVAAMSSSQNFPITPNALQSVQGGLQDGVIFELNASCTNLIWSTFMGGSNNDACYVLSFDKQDPSRLYVAGGTESSNFNTTAGTITPNYQGFIDGFLLRINALSKNLVASTFIGTGAYDQVYGVQTDDSNNVFIMGQTQGGYPVTAGVYSNPTSPQFISKLDASLANILVSTVFGTGSLATTDISPTAFLVDRCGNIYVSGWGGPTGGNPGSTTGLPISTPPVIQSTTDGSDFYYFALSRNMTSLLYATFFGLNSTTPGLGGEHVDGGTSRFDPNGVIYQAICAACGNTPGFPTTPGAYAQTNGSANCNLGAVKIDFQLQDPNATASANGDDRGCIPHQVTFSNNSVSATGYIWDFGDGSPTSTQTTPTHTYTTAGIYTVTLIAENPNGCTFTSDTDQIVITVLDDSIAADFTFTKVDSCNPFTANFTNTSTFNGGATNPWTTYAWDFGDGTFFNGETPPMHNFPSSQSYTITLIMTDTMGCNSPDTVQYVVDYSTSIVTAAFQVPDSICIPAIVNFNDLSQNVTTYAWTFGDGGTSSATNPTHTYTSPGQYTVTLITENLTTCNLRDTFDKVLTVFPGPTAAFTYTPNPPQPNQALDFINQSIGANAFEWDFGDGTTSSMKDPSKIYERDGFYNVCLTAINEFGCKDTACDQVRGYVIPLVDVPSGFSPNGDGVNDIVRVLGYGIETLNFKIFNRWGEKVFETTDRYEGWDGVYKGQAQEMDAYGYTLDVTFFDDTRVFKKGNITLLR